MDANKRLKLIEIEYTIRQACVNCKHGSFPKYDAVWGDCKNFTYKHIKHGIEKPLSINRLGSCKSFELNDMTTFNLEGFSEFLKEQS